MENLRDYVNELKLRASYGEVGNQNGIGRYDGIQLYNYKSNSGALLGNSKGTYVESAGLVSTVRTWERIYNYNLGIELLPVRIVVSLKPMVTMLVWLGMIR